MRAGVQAGSASPNPATPRTQGTRAADPRRREEQAEPIHSRKPYPDYVRAEALRLRTEEGIFYAEIGRRLGVPRHTVFRWLNPEYAERNRALARQAKRRRKGTCEDCGTETNYNGHGGDGVSRLCPACSAIRNGAAKKVWTRAKIIAAIQWWADLYGTQPAIPDFNPTGAALLNDHQRAVRAERHLADGQIPSFTTVIHEFGSWNAGIAAAGFVPFAPHGGNGNELRRRKRYAA